MSIILGKIEQLTNNDVLDEIKAIRRYLWDRKKVYKSGNEFKKAYCSDCIHYEDCKENNLGITIECDDFEVKHN